MKSEKKLPTPQVKNEFVDALAMKYECIANGHEEYELFSVTIRKLVRQSGIVCWSDRKCKLRRRLNGGKVGTGKGVAVAQNATGMFVHDEADPLETQFQEYFTTDTPVIKY